MSVVLVAAGGALGAVLRFALIRLNDRWPLGTLVANVVGSLLLGVLVGVTDDPLLRAGLGTGLLGGLTTFSTFAGEVAARPGRAAAVYATTSLVTGVLAAAVGLMVGALVRG